MKALLFVHRHIQMAENGIRINIQFEKFCHFHLVAAYLTLYVFFTPVFFLNCNIKFAFKSYIAG